MAGASICEHFYASMVAGIVTFGDVTIVGSVDDKRSSIFAAH
jgi:hypothetical protein